MTISDLGAALRRFWAPALAAFVLIFGLGVASLLLREERFRSSAVLSIEPANDNLGFEAQQAIQLTIPPTLARVRSPVFADGIRQLAEPRFRTAPLRIIASNEPGTAIINFAVESSSREAARSLAQTAVSRLDTRPGSLRFDIAVVTPPGPATSVRAQRAPAVLGGTFVLGLIVAVLGAAAAHRLRPRLPRADEFREQYGHEVLGEIPRARRRMSKASSAQLNGSGSPEVIEAFRNLEAKLTMRALAGGRDLSVSIAITSWGKGEGVSTVVTNLACALAVLGRDVTVVDCDMRRPSVHRLLGLDLEPGVAEICDGEPVATLRKPTEHRSLDVVTAGSPSRHPAEITQEALPRLLAVLQDRTVIIDTPPMFTAETTSIAAAADCVVLVADYVERKPDEIDSALAELALTGTQVLGVVLNRVAMRSSRGRESFAYQADRPRSKRRRRRA
ncbi:MAG: P-loop NTPase [Actinobacteria bacterium]|nr:P-loop NTPase [Actinomycetota bacterium]